MIDLLLLGPTACGKTTLALALQKRGVKVRVLEEVDRGQYGGPYVFLDGCSVRLLDACGLARVDVEFVPAHVEGYPGFELRVNRSGENSHVLRFVWGNTEHGGVPAWPDRAAGAMIGLFPELVEHKLPEDVELDRVFNRGLYAMRKLGEMERVNEEAGEELPKEVWPCAVLTAFLAGLRNGLHREGS